MSRYARNWEAVSRKARERDTYVCQDCGFQSRRNNCHHIIPKHVLGPDEPWNLRTVCYPCHGLYPFHEHIREKIDYTGLTGYRPKVRAVEKDLIRKMHAIKKDRRLLWDKRQEMLEQIILEVKKIA